ncbi:MAG: YfbM family protein [Planctomycetaceae bacterium]|nr:YfbM family protein [Planctomycetaceae bacterium]
MSMIGNYRRLTPLELNSLRENPRSVMAFLYSADRSRPPENRHLDIEKSWHVIHFLLNGDAWDGDSTLVNVVLGGSDLSDEGFGYGTVRFLLPDEVREVSEALSDVPAFELLQRFDAEALNDAEIYPHGWSDDSKEGEYIRGHYVALQEFFDQAAKAGDAMLLYLN